MSLTPRAPLKLSSAPHICLAFPGSPHNCPSWSCHQQTLNLAARPQPHPSCPRTNPRALCSVRVSRCLTKLTVFPGLTEFLISGSDPHPQGGDETGTRWGCLHPSGDGDAGWPSSWFCLRPNGLDLSQSDNDAQAEFWASLRICR